MGNKISFVRKRRSLERLESIQELPFFSLNKKIDMCRVSKCYDGDTIHIVIFIKKRPYQLKCRLLGIDTAEIRGSGPAEKEFAYKTRDFLTSLILDKIIYVQFGEFDNFGRVLAHFYLDRDDIGSDNTLSQHLINLKFGYEYYGKTKRPFSEWNDIDSD